MKGKRQTIDCIVIELKKLRSDMKSCQRGENVNFGCLKKKQLIKFDLKCSHVLIFEQAARQQEEKVTEVFLFN